MSTLPTSRRGRRQFLAGVAAATVGLIQPARGIANRAQPALTIGMIGIGSRGSALLGQIISLAPQHNVRIGAVCDVWRVNRERAVERVTQAFSRPPQATTRFAELLALPEVDAVIIATPDFAHGPILVAALEAGKDVYVEKPMSIDLAAANRALDLARAKDRVVQVGTQYRSHGGYTAAARELAAGALGRVHRVRASANFHEPRWARSYADCLEQDVDWPAYLLNRQQRPFDARLLRCWQLYRDCTNGLPGLWMSHYVDAVHLITGAKYPTSAVSSGGIYVWRDGREHCDTFHTLLDYPDGFLLDWSMSLGNSAGTMFQVFGTQGVLDFGSNYATPTQLVISAATNTAAGGPQTRLVASDPGQDHMGNWLACLRTRTRPNADIEFGHQHAVATIMAAAAQETGRRQKYDPSRRAIFAG